MSLLCSSFVSGIPSSCRAERKRKHSYTANQAIEEGGAQYLQANPHLFGRDKPITADVELPEGVTKSYFPLRTIVLEVLNYEICMLYAFRIDNHWSTMPAPAFTFFCSEL